MAEQEHTHHHHHHHKPDGASRFKRKSLAAMKRRKMLVRVFKRVMVALAVIMVLAVFLAYTIG